MKFVTKQATSILGLVLLGSSMVTLSACSATSRITSSEGFETTSENWFCQTGIEAEQWECIQSDALAASPKPTRSPPVSKPDHPQPTLAAVAMPTKPPSPTTERASHPEPASGSVIKTEVAEQANALPEYIRQAYRPEQAVAMLDIPKHYWAVQMIALSSKEALEEFATRHNIKGMSAARIARDDKLFYVLLLGIYESKQVAESVSANLKAPFDNPWVRSVGSLQAGMRAADKLSPPTNR